MRKCVIAALTAAVCLLSGCGKQQELPAPVISDAPAPNISVEVENHPPQPPEHIFYAIAANTRAETVCTEEGVTLLTSSVSYPQLTAYRGNGSLITAGETEKETAALAAVEAFNQHFLDWSSGGSAEGDIMAGDLEIATEDYAWRKAEGMEWFSPYTMELSCTTYQTKRMVSVSGLYYSYTGGAHGNSAHLAWNFDLENGTFFGPELLGGAELQAAVTEELKRQSVERATELGATPEELYWADYETILADWESSAVAFNETGMTVSYSPYELAAYAFGAQIFEIPYEVLEPYLSLQGLAILGLAEEPGNHT